MTAPGQDNEQVVQIRDEPAPATASGRLGDRMRLGGYSPPVLAEPVGGPIPTQPSDDESDEEGT